jgi:hypothetical protein
MKTETQALLNAPPWSPIRGRIVGRLELLFVRDRGAGRTHRRLVGRYDLRGMELRDRELAVPTFEAAWAGACRVAKRERNKQRRFELGNERARSIQEASRREAEAARLAEGIKPELNLTIKGEWLDAILYRGKREEYRSADNRQCLRLWRECESGPVRHFPLRPIVAVLRAGYAMSSRAAAVLVNSIAWRKGFLSKWCDGSVHRDPPCEHWGEPREEPHFALGIQRVLTVGSYSFIRGWVATPDAARAVAVARAEGPNHA